MGDLTLTQRCVLFDPKDFIKDAGLMRLRSFSSDESQPPPGGGIRKQHGADSDGPLSPWGRHKSGASPEGVLRGGVF